MKKQAKGLSSKFILLLSMTGALSVVAKPIIASPASAQYIGADQVVQKGITGKGITVGIISNTFNNKGGYASDITGGYLPNSIYYIEPNSNTYTNGQAQTSGSGDDEGRAMAQVIHSIAPDANILFVSSDVSALPSNPSIARFPNGSIEALLNPQLYGAPSTVKPAQIIVDDIGANAAQRFDNVLTQSFNTLRLSPVPYFSAADNRGGAGIYNIADLSNPLPSQINNPISLQGVNTYATGINPININGNGYQNFDGQGTNLQNLSAIPNKKKDGNITINFAITTSQGPVSDPYTFVLYDDQNNFLTQVTSSKGLATIQLTDSQKNLGNYQLAIQLPLGVTDFNDVLLKYSFGDRPNIINSFGYFPPQNLPAGLTPNDVLGSIYGHPLSTVAAAVGAADCHYSNQSNTTTFGCLAGYSVVGNSPIIDNSSYLTENKPNFLAPSGVAVSNTVLSGNGFFSGTSAAAPHAGAVAALMLQANPSLSAQNIYQILQDTASLPNGFTYPSFSIPNTIGQNCQSPNYTRGNYSPCTGYGLINALNAVNAATVPEPNFSLIGVITVLFPLARKKLL